MYIIYLCYSNSYIQSTVVMLYTVSSPDPMLQLPAPQLKAIKLIACDRYTISWIPVDGATVSCTQFSLYHLIVVESQLLHYNLSISAS